ncbi:MAG: hypothetical protein AABW88_05295 [Nanoarchaeota archaeon]
MKRDYLSSLYGSEDLQRVNFSLDGVVREAFETFLTTQAENLMFSDINEQKIARENLESVSEQHPEYKPLVASMIKLCRDPNKDVIGLKIKQAGAIYIDDFNEAAELQTEINFAENEMKQSVLATLVYFPKFEVEHQRTDYIPKGLFTKKPNFEYYRFGSTNQN